MTGGQRSLMSSAKSGDLEELEEAVEGGALLNQHEVEGRAAIHHAAAAGHHHAVAFLLQAKADPDLKSFSADDDGGRAIHLAAEVGHSEVLRTLVREGANPDATDNKGRGAVHWAALRGQVDSLETLQELGCDLQIKVNGRANALHFAVASGKLEVVRFLVLAGVNKDQKDKNNKFPSDVAKAKGYKDIHHYLKEKTHSSRQAPPSPRGTLTRRTEDQRTNISDPLLADLHQKLTQLEKEKSEALEEARALRDELELQQHQGYQHQEEPNDLLQRLQLLSHENREYKRKLNHMEEEALELRHRVEEEGREHQRREYEDEQQQDPQHLQILAHQNKEYRARLTQIESREAELVQRAAADKQRLKTLETQLQALREELKQSQEDAARHQELASKSGAEWAAIERAAVETRAREKEASERVSSLTLEVQRLTQLLNDTSRMTAATQEGQQKRIMELREQEEWRHKMVENLTERLREAEARNRNMEVEVMQRESRNQHIIAGLRQEVTSLHHRLQHTQSQHQPGHNTHKVEELQHVLQQLQEDNARKRQTINRLQQQVDSLSHKPPTPQQPPPLSSQDQKRLRELSEKESTNTQTIAHLNTRLADLTEKTKQFERAVYTYKIKLAERERELRGAENNKQTVVDLREEVKKLTERLALVRQKAATARNSMLLSEEE